MLRHEVKNFLVIQNVVVICETSFLQRLPLSTSHGPLARYAKLHQECREPFRHHCGLAIQICITARWSRTCKFTFLVRDACIFYVHCTITFDICSRDFYLLKYGQAEILWWENVNWCKSWLSLFSAFHAMRQCISKSYKSGTKRQCPPNQYCACNALCMPCIWGFGFRWVVLG